MKRYIVLLLLIAAGILAFRMKMHPDEKLPENIAVNGKLFTALYQQQAAEYKALCLQAYTIARLRVDEALQQGSSGAKAVITDLDETTLDNSPFAVHQALQGKDYEPSAWLDWTSRAQCDTLAGSVSFFRYAAGKGIEVYYITNRGEKERTATLANLKRYGFPDADNEHLLMKQSVSSKEDRRQAVAATHDIILLLGDNLADFSAAFDKKTTAERMNAVQQLAGEFGKRFIVLPNANYGDWENAIYQYNYTLTPAQKDSVIRSCVKSY